MISIINANNATRKKLAWSVVVDAISRNEGACQIKRTNFEMMSSSLRELFYKKPTTKEEWDFLLERLNGFISSTGCRAIDENIITYFLKKRNAGVDVSDFFCENLSPQNSRLINFTKREFKFNDNKKEDEELY